MTDSFRARTRHGIQLPLSERRAGSGHTFTSYDPIHSMRLSSKLIAAAVVSLSVTVATGLLLQRKVIRDQGIESTRNTMRAAVLAAENVRESVSAMNKRHAFDQPAMLAELKSGTPLRSSTLYRTIPVVAAWEAIQDVSKKEGFEFRVPKRKARNPANNPTPEEEAILKYLESGKEEEYFQVDKARNQIVYARPIALTADCLACHGNPADSPTGDGKDLVGFAMEGWKVGEIHGAFVLKARLDRVDHVVKAGMETNLAWMLPLALVIGIGFHLLSRRMIVDPLTHIADVIGEGSSQLSLAAGQVSSAGHALAEGASQQAAAPEETSASLEAITSMVKRNAASAAKAKEWSGEARTSADAGAAEVDHMKEAMDAIKASSDDVAKILKDIDEIAFQTNILALNTAVEAARAGEAGAGFAVVAEAVRSLAQRSAKAARETADKIDEVIERSKQGIAVSDRVAEVLRSIIEKARGVDDQIAEIANASKEQSMGVEQVSQAVHHMDVVTQGKAASAEESASAAEELNSQAAALRDVVEDLLVIVGKDPSVGDGHSASGGIPHSGPAPRTLGSSAAPAPAHHPAPAVRAMIPGPVPRALEHH